MTLLIEKAETEILKTDVLGRVWTPKEKREAVVAEYKRSAMSASEFAKWSGIKYGTLTGWLARARKAERGQAKDGAKEESMRWAEAVCEVRTPGTAAPLILHFGEIRVEARDAGSAAELLRALGVKGC
jgi:transposase